MTCELLETMVAAHGGNRKWFEFDKATAVVSIDGEVWASGSAMAFAHTEVEILTQEESVTLVSLPNRCVRSVFKPNIIQLETPGEELLETRYNPKSSFHPGGKLSDWDRFQLAYVCSYSIWNCLTQPFLFTYSGFDVKEVSALSVGGETWRGVRVTYPAYIASPSREVICYVGDDGLMRRQDFVHQNLDGIGISSFMTEYADIQGLRIPVKRSLYPTKDLDKPGEKSLFATIGISDLRFS